MVFFHSVLFYSVPFHMVLHYSALHYDGRVFGGLGIGRCTPPQRHGKHHDHAAGQDLRQDSPLTSIVLHKYPTPLPHMAVTLFLVSPAQAGKLCTQAAGQAVLSQGRPKCAIVRLGRLTTGKVVIF
jgi:hypothetical protein